MPSIKLRALCFVAMLAVTSKSAIVVAQPLSLFRDEALAQRHCPDDIVVWLDFDTHRYYTKNQYRFGRGRKATFVCRAEARGSGYKRSLLGRW